MSTQNSETPDPRPEPGSRQPEDAAPRQFHQEQADRPEPRLSNDPDPYPDSDVAQVRSPGLGVPEEDPDPPLPG